MIIFKNSTTGPLYYTGVPGGPIVSSIGLFGCNYLFDSLCPAQAQGAWNAAEASPTVLQLDFTVGTGELDIQMAWAFADYSPPTTPLPAALPLFATGLGVMGLLGWGRSGRLRHKVAA